MMILSAHILWRHLVLTLLTVALLSVPFAHRVGAAPMTSDMALFLSAGGEIKDICGKTGDHLAGGCESCRMNDGMLLAKPTHTVHIAQIPRVPSALPFVQRLAALPAVKTPLLHEPPH